MRHHCSLQAYDRLVHPEQLVTSGPYRLVQHPIYLSYMLLFVGHCIRQGRACERGAPLRAGGRTTPYCACLASPSHTDLRLIASLALPLPPSPPCSLSSLLSAAVLCAVCVAYYTRRIAIEEGLLGEAFGPEYAAYCRSTGRLLPRLRPA